MMTNLALLASIQQLIPPWTMDKAEARRSFRIRPCSGQRNLGLTPATSSSFSSWVAPNTSLSSTVSSVPSSPILTPSLPPSSLTYSKSTPKPICPTKPSKPSTPFSTLIASLSPNTLTAFSRFSFPTATSFVPRSISSRMLTGTAWNPTPSPTTFSCAPSVSTGTLALPILCSTKCRSYGVEPDTKSCNILMRPFCLNGDISIAYSLFNIMFKRDVVPDIESYRILMQALCRKSRVNGAVDLLEDMLNGDGRTHDACKVISDMRANGSLPNLVSYRTLVSGLCNMGMLDEASKYMEEMLSKDFSPHFAVVHALVKGFCNVGRTEDACGVLTKALEHGEAPHVDTWMIIMPVICEVDDEGKSSGALEEVLKIEIKGHTRIVDAGIGLENYLIGKIRSRSRAC
ncbi:Pentatricopeptide repeat-containing protein, mitochondrial [Glycine soja]|uniref:Pentatricopeptide repeat-containing protein, mitochondrial n=1 Tax=Glycine soja TaxID=3848 RepID=A0A0B2PPR0_GLYSO|nr:Pentatricopeptide repeat-containing protein, mitochondrial [Glycine soja]